MSAAFHLVGMCVVTASDDNTAQVLDAATGEPLVLPFEHHDKVVSAAFSPDGKRVVTASDDGTARVWDAATGESPISAHRASESSCERRVQLAQGRSLTNHRGGSVGAGDGLGVGGAQPRRLAGFGGLGPQRGGGHACR